MLGEERGNIWGMRMGAFFVFLLLRLLLLPLCARGEINCPSDTPENTVIRFPDKNFEDAVRKIIGKREENLLKNDVSRITELDVER